MSVTLPTTAFDPAQTIIPKKTFVTLTPSGGSAVSLVGKVLDFDQSFETTKRDVPGTDGILMPDRKKAKSRMQSFKFEVEDVKAMDGAFTGTGIGGEFTVGTAELFITDPDDAANTVALHSNVFKASWSTDGLKNQHGEVSKATITIEAMEKVTLTADVATGGA